MRGLKEEWVQNLVIGMIIARTGKVVKRGAVCRLFANWGKINNRINKGIEFAVAI